MPPASLLDVSGCSCKHYVRCMHDVSNEPHVYVYKLLFLAAMMEFLQNCDSRCCGISVYQTQDPSTQQLVDVVATIHH